MTNTLSLFIHCATVYSRSVHISGNAKPGIITITLQSVKCNASLCNFEFIIGKQRIWGIRSLSLLSLLSIYFSDTRAKLSVYLPFSAPTHTSAYNFVVKMSVTAAISWWKHCSCARMMYNSTCNRFIPNGSMAQCLQSLACLHSCQIPCVYESSLLLLTSPLSPTSFCHLDSF